jgi:hypothetical protein
VQRTVSLSHKREPWAIRHKLALLVDTEMLYIALCADLSSDLAECAIERFAEANFSRINNKSGFLMVRCAASACHLPAPAASCLTMMPDLSCSQLAVEW